MWWHAVSGQNAILHHETYWLGRREVNPYPVMPDLIRHPSSSASSFTIGLGDGAATRSLYDGERLSWTLYVGVTSNLLQRIYQHRDGALGGFTAQYDVKRLVWFEIHETMEAAIAREKQLKNWRREWKVALIEEANPIWRDIAEDFGFDRLLKKVDPGSSPG